MAESEQRIVTKLEAISIAQKGQKKLLSPCGGCEMSPDSCTITLVNEPERALSYDPDTGSALCLKFRQTVFLDRELLNEKKG